MIWTILYIVTFIFEAFLFGLASLWFLRSRDSDVRRRWIASVFVGILSGLAINFILTALLLAGIISNADINQVIERIPGMIPRLPQLVASWANLLLGVLAWMTVPVVFISTFGSYYQFRYYSNSLIDKYWRNPRIQYSSRDQPFYPDRIRELGKKDHP
jgi:hypothetical protein